MFGVRRFRQTLLSITSCDSPMNRPRENDLPMKSIHVTRWGPAGPRVVMVHGSSQGSEVGGDGHFLNRPGF